ncbi:hypothetical protein BB562_11510 [Lactiplantibacillus pentosus]|nr:hypothetical protein BB562_11510 [Lactiplantibacillus pentosus]MCT3277100.1 hypothetical protein [Lactiplantibacillus pentosus]
MVFQSELAGKTSYSQTSNFRQIPGFRRSSPARGLLPATALDEMANRTPQGKLAIKVKNRGAHSPKNCRTLLSRPNFGRKKRAATRAALLKAKLIEEQR